MKNTENLIALLCVIFLAGCVSQKSYSWKEIHRTVEPKIPSREAGGFLRVHTEKSPVNTFSSEDHYYALLPYALYDETGKFLRTVENRADIHGEEPALIPLPPGQYVVVPDVLNTRREIVGVIIEDGKTTEVKLADN